MSFTADVHRIAEKMGESVETVAAATFIELFNAVIKDTPVLEGRLQGNWQTTKTSPANGEVDRLGSLAVAEVHSTIKNPSTYYLTNNLPYAAVAEFGEWPTIGFSPKAPRGMVRVNVKRLKQILRKEATKL